MKERRLCGMIPNAIVYTSKTGFTRQYAQLLGRKWNLPVYSMEDAFSGLAQGSPVLYLGWIHASHVKGFSRAAKRFSLCGVCGVGLCDTGTMLAEVRRATAIPEDIPLFTLQGGFDRGQLKGMDKLLIGMLVKGLSSQKERSDQDERMLLLLQQDGSYVREENLADILAWYDSLEKS